MSLEEVKLDEEKDGLEDTASSNHEPLEVKSSHPIITGCLFVCTVLLGIIAWLLYLIYDLLQDSLVWHKLFE